MLPAAPFALRSYFSVAEMELSVSRHILAQHFARSNTGILREQKPGAILRDSPDSGPRTSAQTPCGSCVHSLPPDPIEPRSWQELAPRRSILLVVPPEEAPPH